MQPDFSKYSLSELNEVKCAIDRIQYPERYELVIKLIAEKSPKTTNAQKSELEKEESLSDLYYRYENVQVNFPKWKLMYPRPLLLALVTGLFTVFYYLINLTFIISLLISLCSVLLPAYCLVLMRKQAYMNFLKHVGDELDIDRFYNTDLSFIASLVPFKNSSIFVFASFDDSALLLKRGSCYVAINFEDIDSFDSVQYFYGYPVVKVQLASHKDVKYPLYVPMSDELAKHITFPAV